MSATEDFKLYGQTCFFEKADAPEGQRRRIAGIISTETKDRQDEIVIQNGLDFTPFLTYGHFNDNHAKNPGSAVGAPLEVRQFQKGQTLPNGKVAISNCTWAEGILYPDYPKAEELWDLGISMEKSGGLRSLGFSIEGKVKARTGPDRKTIAKAEVEHVAITHVPVNPETKLECLAKSLHTIEQEIEKALTQGSDKAEVDSPKEGDGAGAILSPQDLDHNLKDPRKKTKKKKGGKISKSEALSLIRDRIPSATERQLIRVYELAKTLEKK
jgi:hypothetical protein